MWTVIDRLSILWIGNYYYTLFSIIDKVLYSLYHLIMGKVPKAETERDQKLIADYLKGNQEDGWEYSISELGLKYARVEDGKTIPLTATRIHQILNKYGVEKNRVPVKVEEDPAA